jgi:hypothetical protein
MTAQEFVEKAPLYTRVPIQSFTPPGSIMRMCENAQCKRETTWFKAGNLRTELQGTRPDIDLQHVAYKCGLCEANSMGVIYELLEWSQGGPSQYSHKAVRKVGQLPPASISVPPALTERLGTSAPYYKNALICRNSNFGIGAMSYLRRVVDEHTDNLIDVMADLSRTYSVPKEDIEKLLAAKSEVQYKVKLSVAAELIPAALRPGGVNPLGQLYKHTSIGLHNKTDEECIVIFDDLRQDFEYIFTNLHLQAEERRQFVDRIVKRSATPE